MAHELKEIVTGYEGYPSSKESTPLTSTMLYNLERDVSTICWVMGFYSGWYFNLLGVFGYFYFDKEGLGAQNYWNGWLRAITYIIIIILLLTLIVAIRHI